VWRIGSEAGWIRYILERRIRDPYRSKSLIRIRINVKSPIRIRIVKSQIRIRINGKSPIRIRIVKSPIRISIKVTSRIRIRIKVKNRIRIRINVKNPIQIRIRVKSWALMEAKPGAVADSHDLS
jgi:hypothetical protein